MTIYAQNAEFACFLLGDREDNAKEFMLFYQSRVLVLQDQPEELARLQRKYPDLDFSALDTWAEEFMSEDIKHFVLLKKPEDPSQPIQIVGIADIFLDEEGGPPELSNRYIMKIFRGQGLSGILYDAQLKYLAERTNHAEVQMFIAPNNEPNIRAATSHGFVKVSDEVFERDGEQYNLYKKRLDDLRPNPQNGLDLG